MNLPLDLHIYTKWRGSPKEAAQEVATLVNEFYPMALAPTERMLRDWREEGILTRAGHKFTGRNILEATYIAGEKLRQGSLIVLKEKLQVLDDEGLIKMLLSPVVSSTASADPTRIELTVILLAHGVLKQFQQIREGGIVGITENTPLPLRQAQAHLSKLALESGLVDEYASIHNVIMHCTLPLKEWAPPGIAQDERFANAVLIDPIYNVPSEDCGALAELGRHAEDVVERQLYQSLLEALKSLPEEERGEAYTFVRQFICEHPLVSREELREVRNSPRLTDEVSHFFDLVYTAAHPADALNGFVHRCGYCNSHLHPDSGICALASCAQMHSGDSKESKAIPLAQAWIARPEIRKYWCDPAQEELLLYRGLRDLYGSVVMLYPHLDRCDVAVGNEIGIDVKDYQDPVSLARKLANGLGGLRLYPRMILAIATRRARQEFYLDRLYEHLPSALRRSLQIMSVQQVLKILRQEQSNA